MAVTLARRGFPNAGAARSLTSAVTNRKPRRLAPNPLEPRPERRQKLVLRKAGLLRSVRQIVVDRDPVALAEALRGVDVDRDQVHRHATDDGQSKLTSKCAPRRREAAQIAVAISDVEDGGLSVLGSSEGGAIAAGLACADRPPLNDLSFDARDLPYVPCGFRSRNAAVHRQAGSNEVEAIVVAEENAGGIGEGVEFGRNACRDVPKPLQLRRVHLAVLVSASEMAVQRVDREAVQRADLIRSKPQAIDPGVDHHVA